ncbi:hypothetical protein HMN09_00823900 [Mycena chlorophos]|uniref:Uncharacterized protein n=1 Tax=Mycena chlorophos TaxID=658473 RepID=A0A8H6SWM8_MYCCL|nr:hypothetical protein HMN09_00823900 [Mycena chlorophos]
MILPPQSPQGTDHVSSEDVRPPKSPLTSPLRLLRRNRDAFPDCARGVPPVPPLPIAFPGHEEQLTERPAGGTSVVVERQPSPGARQETIAPSDQISSLTRRCRIGPCLKCRPWALGDEGTGGRATHPDC